MRGASCCALELASEYTTGHHMVNSLAGLGVDVKDCIEALAPSMKLNPRKREHRAMAAEYLGLIDLSRVSPPALPMLTEPGMSNYACLQ